jgi:hypothetical protein
MRQSSGTKARNLKQNVFEILEATARAGDEVSLQLLAERRAAEKAPPKPVKPPPYRAQERLGFELNGSSRGSSSDVSSPQQLFASRLKGFCRVK